MPEDKGYPNGKDERADVVQAVPKQIKTSVPRKGKRMPSKG